MKVFLHSLILILLGFSALGQKPAFQSPVKVPIFLTGSFGELRSNHFHSGIDIRTNGQSGLPLHSAGAGYVSRVSVSPSGYGLALYIDHPNGYTTVYGHLDRLVPKIADWVREQQYERKRFAVNLTPEKGAITVEKDELVGWTGNSGNSGGPHLHFEIRNSRSEQPINPLLWGYKINDTKSPVISFIHFYPLSDDSQVAGSTKNSRYKTVLYQGAYHIEKTNVINAYGEIGLGLDAIDYIDGTWSKCGIYRLELSVNSQPVFSFSLDSLDFDYSTHFLSHIDYVEKVRGHRMVHRNFTDPGNQLEIYRHQVNRGLLRIETGKTYQVEYLVADVAGNTSRMKFTIKGTQPSKHTQKEALRRFRYDVSNSYRDDQFAITLPEGSLFSNLDFQYERTDSVPSWAYSPIHKVHSDVVPLGKPVSLVLKPENLPDSLESKAIIVRIDPSGQRSSMGGTFRNGWVETTIRSFGKFSVAIDNKPPVITPLSIKDKTTLTEPNRIRFKITDNLSGIDQYNGFIDNEWVLFEYDAKSNTIVYYFDDKLIKGKKHDLLLKVSDVKGNQSEFSCTFRK